MALPVSNPNVRYFGYGAHVSGDLMEAVIGRRPSHRQAALKDYELRVLGWGEIPESVQSMLARSGWGPDFQVYSLRPKEGSVVHGMLWNITEEEREVVDYRQMNGLWFKALDVAVEAGDEILEGVQTEMIPNSAGEVVDGSTYDPFLNTKEQTIAAARAGREAYLRERSNSSSKERVI